MAKKERITAASAERVIKLFEECSEVVQACAKVLHHGFDGTYDNGENNRQALEREIGNMLCVLKLMIEGGDVDEPTINAHELEHKPKLLRFTYFQEGSQLKVADL